MEESGWKMVSGDVFRSPKSAMLLCVQLGSGVQIILSSFITLFFAALGAPTPCTAAPAVPSFHVVVEYNMHAKCQALDAAVKSFIAGKLCCLREVISSSLSNSKELHCCIKLHDHGLLYTSGGWSMKIAGVIEGSWRVCRMGYGSAEK